MEGDLVQSPPRLFGHLVCTVKRQKARTVTSPAPLRLQNSSPKPGTHQVAGIGTRAPAWSTSAGTATTSLPGGSRAHCRARSPELGRPRSRVLGRRRRQAGGAALLCYRLPVARAADPPRVALLSRERPTGFRTLAAAVGSSGRGSSGSNLGAWGHSLSPPMGIREFPGGAPRAKSIAVGMRRSPDVSPRRLSDISPQLRQLKYLVVDEAIKEDLKWSRSVEDLTSGPVGLTSIEERILRITGYYGYQPWATSYKSKTPT
ncbi:uncharacterized protein LOC118584612 [Onychomys torridus]|uniref:uncharacterized protein LOC118584612 n=1 Tax=Onychomys torridus TaxID=38674 RepID=UPI00167F8A74|nr:uncharacterized protein LOC118584612 [Onychomys torridus]